MASDLENKDLGISELLDKIMEDEVKKSKKNKIDSSNSPSNQKITKPTISVRKDVYPSYSNLSVGQISMSPRPKILPPHLISPGRSVASVMHPHHNLTITFANDSNTSSIHGMPPNGISNKYFENYNSPSSIHSAESFGKHCAGVFEPPILVKNKFQLPPQHSANVPFPAPTKSNPMHGSPSNSYKQSIEKNEEKYKNKFAKKKRKKGRHSSSFTPALQPPPSPPKLLKLACDSQRVVVSPRPFTPPMRPHTPTEPRPFTPPELPFTPPHALSNSYTDYSRTPPHDSYTPRSPLTNKPPEPLEPPPLSPDNRGYDTENSRSSRGGRKRNWSGSDEVDDNDVRNITEEINQDKYLNRNFHSNRNFRERYNNNNSNDDFGNSRDRNSHKRHRPNYKSKSDYHDNESRNPPSAPLGVRFPVPGEMPPFNPMSGIIPFKPVGEHRPFNPGNPNSAYPIMEGMPFPPPGVVFNNMNSGRPGFNPVPEFNHGGGSVFNSGGGGPNFNSGGGGPGFNSGGGPSFNSGGGGPSFNSGGGGPSFNSGGGGPSFNSGGGGPSFNSGGVGPSFNSGNGGVGPGFNSGNGGVGPGFNSGNGGVGPGFNSGNGGVGPGFNSGNGGGPSFNSGGPAFNSGGGGPSFNSGGGGPSFNSGGGGPSFNSGRGPSFNSGGGPGFNSGGGPGFISGIRPGFNSGIRPPFEPPFLRKRPPFMEERPPFMEAGFPLNHMMEGPLNVLTDRPSIHNIKEPVNNLVEEQEHESNDFPDDNEDYSFEGDWSSNQKSLRNSKKHHKKVKKNVKKKKTSKYSDQSNDSDFEMKKKASKHKLEKSDQNNDSDFEVKKKVSKLKLEKSDQSNDSDFEVKKKASKHKLGKSDQSNDSDFEVKKNVSKHKQGKLHKKEEERKLKIKRKKYPNYELEPGEYISDSDVGSSVSLSPSENEKFSSESGKSNSSSSSSSTTSSDTEDSLYKLEFLKKRKPRITRYDKLSNKGSDEESKLFDDTYVEKPKFPRYFKDKVAYTDDISASLKKEIKPLEDEIPPVDESLISSKKESKRPPSPPPISSESLKALKTPLIKRLGFAENKIDLNELNEVNDFDKNENVNTSVKQDEDRGYPSYHSYSKTSFSSHNESSTTRHSQAESSPLDFEEYRQRSNSLSPNNSLDFEEYKLLASTKEILSASKSIFKSPTSPKATATKKYEQPIIKVETVSKPSPTKLIKESPQRIDLDSRIKLMFGMKSCGDDNSPEKKNFRNAAFSCKNMRILSRPPSPFRSRNAYQFWHRETYYFRKNNPIPDVFFDPTQKRKIEIKISQFIEDTLAFTNVKPDYYQSNDEDQEIQDQKEMSSHTTEVDSKGDVSSTFDTKTAQSDILSEHTENQISSSSSISVHNLHDSITKVNVQSDTEIELLSKEPDTKIPKDYSDNFTNSMGIKSGTNSDFMVQFILNKFIDELKIDIKNKLTESIMNEKLEKNDMYDQSKIIESLKHEQLSAENTSLTESKENDHLTDLEPVQSSEINESFQL